MPRESIQPRVVVTGATGTIGAAVCQALIAQGRQPVGLSRSPARARMSAPGVEWHSWQDPLTQLPPSEALEGADGVIHLLGESVAQRWTSGARRRIRDSRVQSTRLLVNGLRQVADEKRPAVLVSQSATGYYGACGPQELDERSQPGDDFLAGVVSAWEEEALAAAGIMRVVTTRTGVVLSPEGGALAKMLPFFRAGIGGPVAGGRQYVPWVHVDDVVAALRFCLDSADASGAVNVTAATPVTNAELSRALGRALHRPAVLPVPALALKLLYGEMSEIVTTGQRAIPARLQELGFSFRHVEVESALRDVLGSR